MSFRDLVIAMGSLAPVTEELEYEGGELGVNDSGAGDMGVTSAGPELGDTATGDENITEMAIASAEGVKLKRIDTKSENSRWKDYSMTGIHDVYVDGEHAGTLDKRKNQGWGNSGHHYIIRPNVMGIMNPGRWHDITPEEKAEHEAAGRHVSTHFSTGQPQVWKQDDTEADREFTAHDAHKHQFHSQQHAVDYLARAHRMSKEFPSQQDRWNAAYDVKEQYLQGKRDNTKTADTRKHLRHALMYAKSEAGDHPDLHEAIQTALNHPALAAADTHALESRFSDLTFDLPNHKTVWNQPEVADPHKAIRSIHEPWDKS